jgi:hypothetical protein
MVAFIARSVALRPLQQRINQPKLLTRALVKWKADATSLEARLHLPESGRFM